MDWIGLAINLVAIFLGFFIYIGIFRSRFAEKLLPYQYFVLLLVILVICGIGGLLRFLIL